MAKRCRHSDVSRVRYSRFQKTEATGIEEDWSETGCIESADTDLHFPFLVTMPRDGSTVAASDIFVDEHSKKATSGGRVYVDFLKTKELARVSPEISTYSCCISGFKNLLGVYIISPPHRIGQGLANSAEIYNNLKVQMRTM